MVPSVPGKLARRLVSVVCLAAVVLGAAPQVEASASGDTRQQLEQAENRAAAVKVQVNLAVANDSVVEAEMSRLQAQVGNEEAIVASDQSAAQAADAQVAAATSQLDALRAQGRAAHQALVARAVYLYEHPYMQEQLLLDGASSLDDLTTREVLADAVQARTNDLVDAVRQEQILQEEAAKQLAAAQTVADTRHQASLAEYGRLSTALQSEQQVHQALATRITDGDAELAGLAGQEIALEAKLNQASSQLAAQIASVGQIPAEPVLGPVGSYDLQWPIRGVVTQEFGHNGHPGIDIAAAYGTPIVAAGTGVVIYASWESGYGNYTCINHGGGISTCYGHQSFIAVSVGQTVVRGQYIGNEGSTGYSTGPHVHFEVRVNGVVHNPRDFVPGNP